MQCAAIASLLLSLLAPGIGAAEPAITELHAAGKSALLDGDGDPSDWIEIHNPGPEVCRLEGWFLTDDAALLARWRFPAVTIDPGGYIVVLASGKDRAVAGSELHTNFKLDGDGEYLALVQPDGATITQEHAPAYPRQRDGFSYGEGVELPVAVLIGTEAAARIAVPLDDSQGLAWTGGETGGEPFDDSEAAGWSDALTGLGFDLARDDVRPLLHLDFNDASDPAAAADSSGNGNHGSITSHLELTGSGGGAKPAYTADGGGRTGLTGDRSLDFGLHGDGALVSIDGAASGAFDPATAKDAVTISLWILGSAAQPEEDVLFWGSSNADGTGVRSLNAHVPWSDRVVYWDTAGCCDETQRVSKPEPDETRWKGRWNHYAFVKSGDVKQVWQNGELFLEGTNTADLTPIRGLFIGAAPRSGEWSYGGRVDDFALWDRALLPGQIRALAAGASPLALSSLAPFVRTDVSARMLGKGAALFVRMPFDMGGLGEANALFLRIRFLDGFAAYLNGAEVARRNAPAAIRSDSTALAARPRQDAIAAEVIDLSAHLGALRPGTNVLALAGLNDSAASLDFLLAPELLLARKRADRFLAPPTPGAINPAGVSGFVDVVEASAARGYYRDAFTVALCCGTAGAAIHYTTDGSAPAPGSPGSRAYSDPIPIATTTTLRAAAFKEDFLPSPSVAYTFVFAAQAESQPARVAGWPTQWSGGYAADYEVDPDVTRTALPGYRLEDALLSIPAVSITMDPGDLMGTADGIYYNSSQVWERPASMELLYPDGAPGFQINAGIRIHGYTSREHYFTPKHSFRVLFKSAYGSAKLDFPLFPDSDARRFDQVVLRGMSTDSWPVMDGWDGPEPGARRWYREKAQYLREQWMKDSQLDMGDLACNATFVHLFLNGLYWGLYHLTERPTDSFHAEHLGGEREEYDVLKDFAEVHSGDKKAWNEMMALASGGLSTAAAYQRIQGNNPDGSRNPALPKYLDVEDLIDYMILHVHAGADDWPNHNWWAGRRRGPESQGFRFYAWDQEITNTKLEYAHTSWGPRFEDADAYDTPAYLYARLRENPAFRLRFQDRVHRHLFSGGALAPGSNDARWMRRAAEIDQAIVGESARWGDARRAVPFRREVEWLAEQSWLRGVYWPQLHPIALERFRRVGLYPDVAAPVLSRHGGRIEPGFTLTITAPAGTVYYTLDGSDPRLASGGVSPAARAALAAGADAIPLAGTTTVKARARDGAEWSALTEAFFFVDMPLRITEIFYHPPDPAPGEPYGDEDQEFLELENVGNLPLLLAGLRLSGGVRFDFSDAAAVLAPGEFALVVKSSLAFIAVHGAQGVWIAGEYEGELHNAGEMIVLSGPRSEPIHEFRYSDRWHPETDGGGYSLTIADPRGDPSAWGSRAGWRPSRRPGGSPGFDEDAGGLQLPGDFNQDSLLDISDAVRVLTALFIDATIEPPCEGGPGEGGNLKLLDSNGDGALNLSDAVYVLGFLFAGGNDPVLGTACVRVEGCPERCEE